MILTAKFTSFDRNDVQESARPGKWRHRIYIRGEREGRRHDITGTCLLFAKETLG